MYHILYPSYTYTYAAFTADHILYPNYTYMKKGFNETN